MPLHQSRGKLIRLQHRMERKQRPVVHEKRRLPVWVVLFACGVTMGVLYFLVG